jgi:hypothetical protein
MRPGVPKGKCCIKSPNHTSGTREKKKKETILDSCII